MHRVIALVGPTAVGKTTIAVELAQSLDAEIVSCDSMQVYRHMRVLSQVPAHAQRAVAQHHLLECVEPTQPFSVGHYLKIAAPIINRITWSLMNGDRDYVRQLWETSTDDGKTWAVAFDGQYHRQAEN